MTYAIVSRSAAHSPREVRRLPAFISEFTTVIRLMKEHRNVFADPLFRINIQASYIERPSLDYSTLAAFQKADSELQTLRNSFSCSLQFGEVQLDASSPAVMFDVSTSQP